MFSRAVNGAWYGLSFAINLCTIRSRAEKSAPLRGNTTLGFQLGNGRWPGFHVGAHQPSPLPWGEKKNQNKSGRGPFIAVMYECTAVSTSGGDDWSRYMAVVVFDCKSMFPLCPRQCYVCALTINRCGRRDTVLFKNIHLYTGVWNTNEKHTKMFLFWKIS